MTWRLTFRPSAQSELERLDPPTRGRIQRALLRLAADRRQTPNVKTMTDGNYRLRVGDWRVAFALRDDVLVVLVLRVGHRREAYRQGNRIWNFLGRLTGLAPATCHTVVYEPGFGHQVNHQDAKTPRFRWVKSAS